MTKIEKTHPSRSSDGHVPMHVRVVCVAAKESTTKSGLEPCESEPQFWRQTETNTARWRSEEKDRIQ